LKKVCKMVFPLSINLGGNRKSLDSRVHSSLPLRETVLPIV
jgi:hypothetical protein